MSRQNWVDSVYVLCAAKSGLIIGMRHFHEFSCVHRGFISTTTINTLSSIEEKEAYCASEKYMFCAGEKLSFVVCAACGDPSTPLTFSGEVASKKER